MAKKLESAENFCALKNKVLSFLKWKIQERISDKTIWMFLEKYEIIAHRDKIESVYMKCNYQYVFRQQLKFTTEACKHRLHVKCDIYWHERNFVLSFMQE